MEKQKKLCKSNVNCCVYGCKSVRNKNNSLMYHSFPKHGEKIEVTDDFGNVQLCERRKMWETNLRMGKKTSKFMTVCSLHFKSTDYICSGWSSRKRLLPTAVPTENLPNGSHDMTKLQKDIVQTRKNEVDESHVPVTPEKEYRDIGIQVDIQDKKFSDCAVQVDESHVTVTLATEYRDIGIQVDIQDKQFSDCAVQVNISDCGTSCDFVEKENHLKSLTRIHSFMSYFYNIINNKNE